VNKGKRRTCVKKGRKIRCRALGRGTGASAWGAGRGALGREGVGKKARGGVRGATNNTERGFGGGCGLLWGTARQTKLQEKRNV